MPELLPWLPVQSAADAAWRQLVTTIRKADDEHGDDDDVTFDTPLSNEEEGRRRFSRVWEAGDFLRFGPRWGPGLNLFFNHIPRETAALVYGVLEGLGVWKLSTVGGLRAALKAVGGYAKRYGDVWYPEYWKFFVDLNTLGGYLWAEDKIEDFEPAIREWVQSSYTYISPDSEGVWTEDQFDRDFRQGLEYFFAQASNVPTANSETPSRAEWVRDKAFWARGGSSSYSQRPTGRSRGKLVRAKKTKWATALAATDAEIEYEYYSKKKKAMRTNAVQKRETGKVRAVVNSAMADYMLQSRVAYFTETAFAGCGISSLFMRAKQLVALFTLMAELRKSRSGRAIPLDQSQFDHHVTRRLLRILYDVWRKWLVANATDESLLEEFDEAWARILDEEATLNLGTLLILISNGVLSGWRWTAFIDTAVNVGILVGANSAVRRMGGYPPVMHMCAQGDDDWVVSPTWGSAVSIGAMIGEQGFDVNPSKTFISDKRDEYLRQVADGDVTAGYFARAINGILWRNPVSRDPPAGAVRASEQVSSWNTMIGRGGDVVACLRSMRRDVVGANGITNAQFDSLIATPVCMGGLGFLSDPGAEWSRIERGVLKPGVDVDISTIKGVSWLAHRSQELGVDISEQEVAAELASNLQWPVADTLGEMKVVPVERVIPFLWDLSQGEGAIPLSGVSSPEIPRTVALLVLQKAIRAKQWEWIEEVWLLPSMREVSARIRQRGGRRVWLDWLEGKLPFSTPVVPGYSSLQCGVEATRVSRLAWQKTVAKARFNMSYVVRAAYTAEIETRRIVELSKVRLGG
jgi:hypothetical protein